jgi:hypothetical protein
MRNCGNACNILVGKKGTRYHSWLRHYVSSRKVTGAIPDEVIDVFNLPNPSSCTMVLRLTQPLTEMSTRILTQGKARPQHMADSLIGFCAPIV